MNKQLFNNPSDCVDEHLAGFVACHDEVFKLPGHRIIIRKDVDKIRGKVAVISGGGSGHEPIFLGCVGKGMLTGAVAGSVFACPSSMTILALVRALSSLGASEILMVVANYTGDRLNYGLAKELSTAEGIKVETVVVGEDCAQTGNLESVGRRGLAGIVLVYKLAGAMAEEGRSLPEILSLLHEALPHLGTIGFCLQPCIVPGASEPSFTLGPEEAELGLGVHGELGVRRTTLKSSRETVRMMLDHMTDPESSCCLPLRPADEVVVFLNNLGGTSNLEMGILMHDAICILEERGVGVVRKYSGRFMTSLQMVGFSICILKVNEIPELLPLLDAEAVTPVPFVSGKTFGFGDSTAPNIVLKEASAKSVEGEPLSEDTRTLLYNCLEAAAKALLENKYLLNKYDTGAGDADCGFTHSQGAARILSNKTQYTSLPQALTHIGYICSEEMGGTSGAIYAILFTTMGNSLAKQRHGESNTVSRFTAALQAGIEAIKQHGGAAEGDRTMIDVLVPVCNKLSTFRGSESLSEICNSLEKLSREAAQKTLPMIARAGRASYVSKDRLVHPDAGSVAVAIIIAAVAKAVTI